MSRQICQFEECTGCAACRDICPRQCISMQSDSLDALHPQINTDECIDCGLCEKTCPNNREIDFKSSQKVWAAWSINNQVRQNSASGGIACELYKYWIGKGGIATGVVYNREEDCHFVLIEKEDDIIATQNSKYTFSDTAGIYLDVKRKLQDGIPVLFIGVPCQVSGLYGFLKKDYPNLTTVDLICHGMPPASYLKQHIESIEKHEKEQTKELFFRDPKYSTYTYTFTLKNVSGKEFYRKKVQDTDNFQLGYHRALIYRENCYQCHYARKERISDLTIGDFSGLGSFAPFNKDKHNVSCILQNTSKGKSLLESLGAKIYKEERPENEAFEIERQLKQPSLKHPSRTIFEKEYKSSRDFERAANASLNVEKFKVQSARLIILMKSIVRSSVPRCLLSFVRGK